MLGLRSGTGVANEGDLYRVLVESRTQSLTRAVRIASCLYSVAYCVANGPDTLA